MKEPKVLAETKRILGEVEKSIEKGPFKAEWQSLKKYKVPEWYLDAKFGIFMHWGVYAVPAFSNEWYPRMMYQKDSDVYKHHIEKYGPQAKFGYKDFIPEFKAEKFDARHWAEVFKKAGARFVMPVAEHHDGFAMYDTRLSEWKALNMGPKRDVVGELSEAVREQGMVFTLSSHRAEHWWFLDGGRSFDSDVQDEKYADFYGPAQPENSEPDQAYMEDWLARTCELIDKYQPQVVWFDWWIEKPFFKPYLQKLAAFYYNRGIEWGRGVAVNYKNQAYAPGTAVLDLERGQLPSIRPDYWQTDTAVGKTSWSYVEKHDYKSVTTIIADLVDIVSKNGALLLNIGPKADGTIPEPEEKMLLEIGKWLEVNGEAIYGTRPFKVYGEGPTQVVGGMFTDTKDKEFTGQDMRFTVKGDTLYAVALAWHGESFAARSLGTASYVVKGEIKDVALLGYSGRLEWSRDAQGLKVKLPLVKPCEHAFVFKITGLKDLQFDGDIYAGLDGGLTLEAEMASLHGKMEVENQGSYRTLGFWDNPQEWVSWKGRFPEQATYQVSATVACTEGETEFILEAAGQKLKGTALKTTWVENKLQFNTVDLGQITIGKPGVYELTVKAADSQAWKILRLTNIKFVKA